MRSLRVIDIFEKESSECCVTCLCLRCSDYSVFHSRLQSMNFTLVFASVVSVTLEQGFFVTHWLRADELILRDLE